MKTHNSPQNRPRSRKIPGGRIACIVYLPKEEVDYIDHIVNETSMSKSNVIAQIYYQGKKHLKNYMDEYVMPPVKQKRDNRYNINLTDSEADLFIAISKLTGVNIGVILRQFVVKQAIETLIAENVEDEFNLDQYLNKGASDHLSRS